MGCTQRGGKVCIQATVNEKTKTKDVVLSLTPIRLCHAKDYGNTLQEKPQ